MISEVGADLTINQPFIWPSLHWFQRAINGQLMILDDVKHSMSHPSNRMVVFDGKTERVVPFALVKSTRQSEIREVQLLDAADVRRKLESYWQKATYRRFALAVFDLVAFQTSLSGFARATIEETCKVLRLPISLTANASEFKVTTTKVQRLIDLADVVPFPVSTLRLGRGSEAYVEAERSLLNQAKLQVSWQDWTPPIPNRSVLDAIAWYGDSATRDAILST